MGRGTPMLPSVKEEGDDREELREATGGLQLDVALAGRSSAGSRLGSLATASSDQGSAIGSVEQLRRRKIGSKIKLSYTDTVPTPTPKPVTDELIDELARANPPPQVHPPMESIKSPKQPKKRGPKISLTY